ncbi:MAG TPA: endonuclease/exonuclease/phosphatase family protein [Phycisphaerae bacterium]|nr:endonuclease/exonuclease/phosphatase family protein [Phycisphaerae bacterium]
MGKGLLPSKCLLVLIATALGMAAGAGEAPRPASQPATNPTTRFSIATYNINYGNARLETVAATLRKSAADVVCLQETNPQSERYLRRQLRGLYPHMSFRHDGGAGGFAFLSKAPLTGIGYVPRKHGWFGMHTAEVTLGGQKVFLANLHLVPVNPRQGESLVGTFFRSESIRANEITWFSRQLPAKGPVILVGDLNSRSDLYAPQYLRSLGYTDSFAAVTETPDRHTTWRWRYKGIDWQFRIDYIFHSPQLRTLASRVVPSDGSDHNLVCSTLAWAPPKQPEESAARTPGGKTASSDAKGSP